MSDVLASLVARTLRSREPVSISLGIYLDEARVGFARARMLVRDDVLNGHATAHGGMIFTLADTAFAYACNSRNVASVAAQTSIIFLSPAREGDELIAEAVECASVGRSGVYAVHVTTTDGRAIAEFYGLSRTIGGSVVSSENEEATHD